LQKNYTEQIITIFFTTALYFRFRQIKIRTTPVILPFPQSYPADSVELQIPDANAARLLVKHHHPALLALLESRQALFTVSIKSATINIWKCAEDAIVLSFARLALRHGSWGTDFHRYHNEFHVMEILGERINRLIATVGLSHFSAREWLMLALFASCHDLHQRKPTLIFGGLGSNERASTEEAFRVLQQCGFCCTSDADFFRTLELMIAGTTFHSRPLSTMFDQAVTTFDPAIGALASSLDLLLDQYKEGWQKDEAMKKSLDLSHVAADLDTANVADNFSVFAKRADDLCREREMRQQRSLEDPASVIPVLQFLTDQQERFFFNLHRFNSAAGRATFAAGKTANEPKIRKLVKRLRDLPQDSNSLHNGEEVLKEYNQIVEEIEGRGTEKSLDSLE